MAALRLYDLQPVVVNPPTPGAPRFLLYDLAPVVGANALPDPGPGATAAVYYTDETGAALGVDLGQVFTGTFTPLSSASLRGKIT